MPRASFITIKPNVYSTNELFRRKPVEKLLAVFQTPSEARAASLALLGCNVHQLFHETNVVEIEPSHPNYIKWLKMARSNEAWVTDTTSAKATGK